MKDIKELKQVLIKQQEVVWRHYILIMKLNI